MSKSIVAGRLLRSAFARLARQAHTEAARSQQKLSSLASAGSVRLAHTL